MKHRFFIFIFVILVMQGCSYVYTSYTKRLEKTIFRETPEKKYVSLFDFVGEGEQRASIGDELFRINRYLVGEESIRFKAPTPYDFPHKVTWMGTHVYNDGNSGDLVVYTTPSYYNGDLGVILDFNGHLSTEAPLVQVEGAKKGRRWKINGSGSFFEATKNLIENWGIRYGGLKDDKYIFELFNKNEARIVEIIQSIEITETQFLDGFTVRGVFIKGLRKDVQGVIIFKVFDSLKVVSE